MKANCIKCGIEYKARSYRTSKYCSQKCYHEDAIGKFTPWNKGIKWERPKKGEIIICHQCGKEKYFEQNQLRKRPCKYCSVKCARKADANKESSVYSTIHSRMRRIYGKADVCEQCGSTNTVDWANISDKYLLDRNDWKKLCRKCHIHFDKSKKAA